MFSFVHAELAGGQQKISHIYFNGALSKSIVSHYLIGSDDEGNTREVLQEQQIKFVCFFTLF